MKTLKTLLKQKPVFLHDWSCAEDVFLDFENAKYAFDKDKQAALDKHKDDHILFASYTSDGYSGSAFVLFENNGTLYEVNGSHCSCYGLEGQWEREEVSLKELEHRLTKGTFGIGYDSDVCNGKLRDFLGVKEKSKER